MLLGENLGGQGSSRQPRASGWRQGRLASSGNPRLGWGGPSADSSWASAGHAQKPAFYKLLVRKLGGVCTPLDGLRGGDWSCWRPGGACESSARVSSAPSQEPGLGSWESRGEEGSLTSSRQWVRVLTGGKMLPECWGDRALVMGCDGARELGSWPMSGRLGCDPQGPLG